jgi:uncharacterized membrane protein YoaK (UPF0700 family)
MLDRILALFAFVMLCVFVGILVYKLQRWDITMVSAIALLLAGWDLLRKQDS